jgi:hypothetical protein
MEAVYTSEMLANAYQTTRYYTPEYCQFICLCEPFAGDTFDGNLKMYPNILVRAKCSVQQLEDMAVEDEAPS